MFVLTCAGFYTDISGYMQHLRSIHKRPLKHKGLTRQLQNTNMTACVSEKWIGEHGLNIFFLPFMNFVTSKE